MQISVQRHKWWLIGAVLVVGHAVSAWHYGERYAAGIVRTPYGPLTLDLTPEEWADATPGADSSSYLRCAQQVAAGRGINILVPHSDPPRIEPFFYWGPGSPWVFGNWQRLVGGRTMWTFFAFAVAAQLAFGALAVATAALWTRRALALAATALATGLCPPLQDWLYGPHLTSSEIVSLPLWALIFYVLSRGFLAERTGRQAANSSARSRFWGVWPWFGSAGVLIGAASLIRDSSEGFVLFLAAFLVGRAALCDRRRLGVMLTAAVVLVAATIAVRRPVRRWNEKRIGSKVVSTSGDEAIWRVGLWEPHDACSWYEEAGLGFGQYLDPDAPARVEQYYRTKQPSPALYSLGQLIQAIARHPWQALTFKATRLPVLWLGLARWPDTQLNLTAWWCLAFYGMLATFCAVQWRRRQAIPEVLYLYLLMLLAAMPLIHFEFRYTFPVWNTLVTVPGLLIDAIATARRARALGPLAADRRGEADVQPADLTRTLVPSPARSEGSGNAPPRRAA